MSMFYSCLFKVELKNLTVNRFTILQQQKKNIETEYLWTMEKTCAHTTSSTHIYTPSCMPAQKLVYIFMFVDIFCYILWWKTVSV